MPIELVRDFGADDVDWPRTTAETTTAIAAINITFLKRYFIIYLHRSVINTIDITVRGNYKLPRQSRVSCRMNSLSYTCTSQSSRLSDDLLAKGAHFYFVQISDQLFAALFMIGIIGKRAFAYIRSAEHTAPVKQPFMKMD